LYNVKDSNLLALYTAALQDPQVNYKCVVIRGTGVSLRDVKRVVESFGRENMDRMVTLRYISERALLQQRLTALFSTFFGALAPLSLIVVAALAALVPALRAASVDPVVALRAE